MVGKLKWCRPLELTGVISMAGPKAGNIRDPRRRVSGYLKYRYVVIVK